MHGWGFGPKVWNAMEPLLEKRSSLFFNLGLIGKETIFPIDSDVIVIGHSLGVLWLLKNLSCQPRAFVSINGFTYFAKKESYGRNNIIAIKAMIKNCETNPLGVLKNFYSYCGLHLNYYCMEEGVINIRKLKESLLWLLEWNLEEKRNMFECPFLALASCDDPLIPLSASESMWKDSSHLEIAPSGGHILPLTNAHWCAKKINEWVKNSVC